MLLYVCDRCKFSSPKSELCHTCGAKLKKESPAREVLYRIQDSAEPSTLSRSAEICEAAGQFCIDAWTNLSKHYEPAEPPSKIKVDSFAHS